MKYWILLGKTGYYNLLIEPKQISEWANVLYQMNLPYLVKKVQQNQNSYFCLTVSARDYHSVILNFPRLRKGIICSPIMGMPKVKALIQSRCGMLLGIFLCVFFFLFLTSFTWEIRVSGGELYNEEQMLSQLSELGIKEGSFLPKLDIDNAVSSYLESSEEIAWMNIYRKGVVLYVSTQLHKEDENISSPLKSKSTVNLVASRDAVIEELILKGGRPLVLKGTVVKKGDLLVSGVYENVLGYYFSNADGVIKGKVTEEIDVFVPLEETVEKVEKERLGGISLEVFGHNISILKVQQSAEESLLCDKRQIYLFGTIRLPLSITLYRYAISFEETIQIDEKKAVKLAYQRLQQETELRLLNAELVFKKVSGSFENNGYLLKCQLSYIENIAEPIEFLLN